MAQKNVLITINHAPHGSIFCAEGLREAMGVISTPDEHNVVVVFLGDGAYAALAGVDRSDEVARSIAALAEWGYKLEVEMESLESAGIQSHEVAPDVEIIPRTKLLDQIGASDFVVDF